MHLQSKPVHIALAGMLSLGVAMGIGRFAFTPLLPMMLADGVVDLAGASWLASANYLGYLLGALLCTLQPWLWRRLPWLPAVSAPALVRSGLAATCLLTLAMALPAPALWPTLRFAAGVASAVVFVFTSGWCLAELARHDAIELGGVMYTGPGGGILLSGLAATALVAWQQSAGRGWLAFGLLSAVLSAVVWPAFARRAPERAASVPGAAARPAAPPMPSRLPELALLALAYALAGFGYIISATFLPVIARQTLTGSPWLDLFWPIFGLGVIVGALLATRARMHGDMRLLLAFGYAVQATGIAAGMASPTRAGFAFGSFLLGLPFTAITFFAMQEARRLRPRSAHSFIGLLSVMYGAGQIGGPLLAAALLARSATPAQGFERALGAAAAALLVGALVHLGMARLYPLRPPAPGSRRAGTR